MKCKFCKNIMVKIRMNWYGNHLTVWKCQECGFTSN